MPATPLIDLSTHEIVNKLMPIIKENGIAFDLLIDIADGVRELDQLESLEHIHVEFTGDTPDSPLRLPLGEALGAVLNSERHGEFDVMRDTISIDVVIHD